MKDPELTNAVREKVRTIVQTFEVHGLPLELDRAERESSDAAFQDRIAALERQLDLERKSHGPIEMRVTELAAELERDRHLRLNTLAHVGKLSAQLRGSADARWDSFRTILLATCLRNPSVADDLVAR